MTVKLTELLEDAIWDGLDAQGGAPHGGVDMTAVAAHVAEAIRTGLGFRREYQVEGMWYRGPGGKKLYESSGAYPPYMLSRLPGLVQARGGRIVTREASESDWEPVELPTRPKGE